MGAVVGEVGLEQPRSAIASRPTNAPRSTGRQPSASFWRYTRRDTCALTVKLSRYRCADFEQAGGSIRSRPYASPLRALPFLPART